MRTRIIQDEPPQREPAAQKHNLAARMGRWSAQHRKAAIFGWLAFVVVAFALGSGMLKLLDQQEAGVGVTLDHVHTVAWVLVGGGALLLLGGLATIGLAARRSRP